MAYLAVPTRRGSLFQTDKSAHRIFQAKLQQKTEEYYNRHIRANSSDDDEKVTLNIGGKRFTTRKSTLRNVPGTRLAHLDHSDHEHYDHAKDEYFFDRNPAMFGCILDYYRFGTMHIPRDICTRAVKDEMKFWDLKDGCISECCRKFYFDSLDEYATYEMVKAEFYCLPTYISQSPSNMKIHGKSAWSNFREKAWVFIDNHESSLGAKIFAFIYYSLVIVSILGVFVGTLPGCRVPVPTQGPQSVSPQNETTGSQLTEPHYGLFLIDAISLFAFTLEFMFRLIVCPSIVERFKSWYTVTDILYFIPAWSRFIMDVARPNWTNSEIDYATFMIVLDSMIVFRVFRIFRLSRHYRGLRVLLLAIKASFSELFLLFIFVTFSLTIYASFIYSAENYVVGSTFEHTSVFIGLWWSLVTMTTVGYGDFYPSSTIGYIVAAMTALSGILIIGMVVPIIAGNFHLYYGFRHAGSEDVELEKPEFIPTLKDNPLPSEMTLELYKRKSNTGSLFSHTMSLKPRPSFDSSDERVGVKKSLSMIHSKNSIQTESSISNENGNCGLHDVKMESNVCDSPKADKHFKFGKERHRHKSSTVQPDLCIKEEEILKM